MANEVTVDVRVAELDRKIRERYKHISADHIALLIDLYMLIYRYTKRNKTYIDALDLLDVVERNINVSEHHNMPTSGHTNEENI